MRTRQQRAGASGTGTEERSLRCMRWMRPLRPRVRDRTLHLLPSTKGTAITSTYNPPDGSNWETRPRVLSRGGATRRDASAIHHAGGHDPPDASRGSTRSETRKNDEAENTGKWRKHVETNRYFAGWQNAGGDATEWMGGRSSRDSRLRFDAG